MLPSVFNRLRKIWDIDYTAKMPSPDCYRGQTKNVNMPGTSDGVMFLIQMDFSITVVFILIIFTWDWMRNYAFMKIGICIPPHFFSFLSPQKVKLKFSLLQLKTTTVQPDNKEIKQQTKTRRSYFLTSSQEPIFPSQGCLDRLAYLHHMVIVKGNTSKSGRWAVWNESFSPCAVLCHTRDA